MRQIVLDTETTGLDPAQGHRIIEIGCVELINRRLTGNNYHQYVQPNREIDAGAIEVHGITNEFLTDKPRFADIAQDFIEYVKGAELIIHNAPFDVGFLNHEFQLIQTDDSDTKSVVTVADMCQVVDTLKMARSLHPGQKNNLDALCRRYEVDNTQRTLHGALLDSEILADVYMAMTGGQTGLFGDSVAGTDARHNAQQLRPVNLEQGSLRVLQATAEELAAHEAWLQAMEEQTGAPSLWRTVSSEPV